jgi:hypothetical protein
LVRLVRLLVLLVLPYFPLPPLVQARLLVLPPPLPLLLQARVLVFFLKLWGFFLNHWVAQRKPQHHLWMQAQKRWQPKQD